MMNETTAATVIRLRDQGMSHQEIADHMNSTGPHKGWDWLWDSDIVRMLVLLDIRDKCAKATKGINPC